MSTRRRSTLSPASRLSAISVYSITSDLNGDDDDDTPSGFWRCLSAINLHKSDVYHVLERQQGKRALVYHLLVFIVSLTSLVFGSISTIAEWQSQLNTPLYYAELALCIFFCYELVLRIWSAGCLNKYQTWVGRLMFVTQKAIILDVAILCGFVGLLATGVTTGEFSRSALDFLPPLQMVRFLRVDRQLTSWQILKDICTKHRQELTVTIVIGFMFLLIGAYLVYIAENPVQTPEHETAFKSLADSVWFSIITVSSATAMA